MKKKDKGKRVLGRGLSELMSVSTLSFDISEGKLTDNDYGKKLPLELIKPNKNHPRKVYIIRTHIRGKNHTLMIHQINKQLM